MAKELKISEEDAILASFADAGSSKQAQTMPLLVINVDDVDADGKDITPRTFHIKGTDLYSKTVTFRMLRFVNKLISMKQDGKQWKTTNETIFYSNYEQD